MLAVVGLFAVVVLVREVSRRIGFQEPIALLMVGVGFSFVPGIPSFAVEPDLVLMVVLPVLLYGAAFTTSVPSFRENLRSIGTLSIGLTLFTTAAVGFAAHAVIPDLSLAAGMVLGAVVAPQDAVAAVAIGRQAGMPRRAITMLEGESLFNDAAALTAFQIAIAAVVGGSVSPWYASGRFLLATAGGLVVGAVVAFVLAWIRRRVDHPVADAALSLLAPFLAYLPAEAVHGSGIVSVVVTGLYLGHRQPSVMSARSRLVAQATWEVIEYLLAGAVFVLIGLQASDLITGLRGESPGLVAIACAVVVAVVIATRLLWVFPDIYVPRWLNRGRQQPVPWQEVAIVGWAGLRGVVSVGAAFAIPRGAGGGEFPHRDLILFVTAVVIVSTLLLQGLTLPAVVRRWGPHSIHPDDRAAEHADQEVAAHNASADAGLARLDELVAEQHPPEAVVDRLRERADRRRMLASRASGADGEADAEVYRRLRRDVLRAELEHLVRMRDDGELDDEVFTKEQRELDHEDSMLDRD
ncbi:Na+/H+ antiporter [Labedaea rhizosphaerae]|uniref:Sodium/proton antiporter (CPA1 family) n=1 Tax=Labedaea rhizosphaerae TaxID=598644 RepID=A0A4R6S001_LABRH|nr:Na+/H+ antiporter [Labedaea rhizosphaerae]TDP92802.1 sodium/proton antiporter (CPA1 family) [Labedaea rhizosphaerae]